MVGQRPGRRPSGSLGWGEAGNVMSNTDFGFILKVKLMGFVDRLH